MSNLKKPRPTLQDPELILEVVARLMPLVVQWFGNRGFMVGAKAETAIPVESIMEDLIHCLTHQKDSYRMARWLEDQCKWSPDTKLVEILNQAPFIWSQLPRAQGPRLVNKETNQLGVTTKMLTRQDDFESSTELTSRGRENDVEDAPLILNLSVDQCRSGKYTPEREI